MHIGMYGRSLRALACTGDRTVRDGFESHCMRTTSLRNFGNSVYPALPVFFGGDARTIKAVGPSYLAGVDARGSIRSHVPTSPH